MFGDRTRDWLCCPAYVLAGCSVPVCRVAQCNAIQYNAMLLPHRTTPPPRLITVIVHGDDDILDPILEELDSGLDDRLWNTDVGQAIWPTGPFLTDGDGLVSIDGGRGRSAIGLGLVFILVLFGRRRRLVVLAGVQLPTFLSAAEFRPPHHFRHEFGERVACAVAQQFQ